MNYSSAEARRRMAEGTLNPTHGKASTYRHYGCRCEDCRAAHTARVALENGRRRAKLTAGEVEVPHGRLSTYNNYGCRCAPCLASKSAVNAAYAERQRTAQR